MILCNLNSIQLQHLNVIINSPMFEEIVAVRTGDLEVIIEWRNAFDDILVWEIRLDGEITIIGNGAFENDVTQVPEWVTESERLAHLGGTTIDLDDEYMFEQYEAALEDE